MTTEDLERQVRQPVSTRRPAAPDLTLQAGDTILVHGDASDAKRFEDEFGLERLTITDRERTRWAREVGLATVLIHPKSRLVGKTLHEVQFRSRLGLEVTAIRRSGQVITEFLDEKLHVGDALLVLGPWKRIGRLRQDMHDFVVLTIPEEADWTVPERRKAPVALAILVGMVLLSALEIVPVSIAVLVAALAAVLTSCISMEEGYRSIHWSSVILIAGMLPIADALQKSGGVRADRRRTRVGCG